MADAVAPEKSELTWNQSYISSGDIPAKRSGHTFTVIGSNAFLFGGCDANAPAGPTNDVYMLKMAGNFEWVKLDIRPAIGHEEQKEEVTNQPSTTTESTGGDAAAAITADEVVAELQQVGVPKARWGHTANVHDKKFLVIFGGFHSSTNRLNDLWILDTITLTWHTPISQQSTFTPRGNHLPTKDSWAGCPSPRGAHSGSVLDGKLWIFGGYGGAGYSRRDFNDVSVLDLETNEWLRVPAIKGVAPKPRSGHTASVVQEKIYIFGGWNAVQQFNDLFILDTVNHSWENVDTHLEPRWNHAACSVEAIPSFKIFIFGGCTGDLNESKKAQGTFTNSVLVLDSGSNTFDVPKIAGEVPLARSSTELAYDSKGSRLVMFGGWANRWFGELCTLDVGCVVGPPYAIMGIHPTRGPITGEQEVLIQGIDFVNDPRDPRIKVRFATKVGVFDVPGTFVDKETIKVKTPNLIHLLNSSSSNAGNAGMLGECVVDVRVSFRDDSFTTTFQKYTFFQVTDAASCMAFGPGLLKGGCAGVPTQFVLHANDTSGEIRSSGGDEFSVTVKSEDGTITIPDVTIEDQECGSYIVTYTPNPTPATYIVEVKFEGAFVDETGKTYQTGEPGHIRGSPFTVSFDEGVSRELNKMEGTLVLDHLEMEFQRVRKVITSARAQLEKAINPNSAKDLARDVKILLAVKEKLFQLESESSSIELGLDTMVTTAQFLAVNRGMNLEKKVKQFNNLAAEWKAIIHGPNNMVSMAKAAIKPHVQTHGASTKLKVLEFEEQIKEYATSFAQGSTQPFYSWATGATGAIQALVEAVKVHEETVQSAEETKRLAHLFEFPELCEGIESMLHSVAEQIDNMKTLWEVANGALTFFEESKAMWWKEVQPFVLEDEAKKKNKAVKSLIRGVRWCDAYMGLENEVKNFLTTVPLISQLGNKAMRSRHWSALKSVIKKDFTSPDQNENLKLSEVLNLNLHEFAGDVEEIADQAVKEEKIESTLTKLDAVWYGTSENPEGKTSQGILFVEEPHDDVMLLKISEDDTEQLEADQLTVQNMVSSRFVSFFLDSYVDSAGEVRKGASHWQRALSNVADVTSMLSDIQRTWSYLEPLFMKSEEVKLALSADAERFSAVDHEVRKILEAAGRTKNIITACNRDGLLRELEGLNRELEICRKALADYLDTKRTLFPRFYFTSEADLLDILSNGSQPQKIMKHLIKLFLATKSVDLESGSGGKGDRPNAVRWHSGVGKESHSFETPVPLDGKVEVYLQDILNGMKQSMSSNFEQSLTRYTTQTRCEWLLHNKDGDPVDLAQIGLLVSGVHYVREVESVFAAIAAGNKDAMKDYNTKQKHQLQELIELTLKPLSPADRQRVMCMITLDAHNRDIVYKLFQEQVYDKTNFQWQSQLKQRYQEGGSPVIEVCDASFGYGFEYLGNGSRLVITPLTDRIYVTATQALHLKMGCAPAGPAGTGKTESTKDLAASLGKCCYVFNCAPEMDYRSMGNIFKGLAASGSWGCFDEFNRLVPEVLSVCTVQYKAVCDGIRGGHGKVTIEGSEVQLDPTCGAFITMNPGYLGRSELPEGLKALFRPMTVMVPDLVLICENMLMAEGFLHAKTLATKFYALYSLLGELLSKQPHYDWGLRAVKSVLVVAGTFKRTEPHLEEDDLLLRALRDSNLPKIVQQDLPIFHGLLKDLFPGRDPPRKVDKQLEVAIKEACGARDLWPEHNFMVKTAQLEELLAIRHCVFVMGNAAAGKTECWKTLQQARQIMGNKTIVRDINPKAQDPSGLYGYVNMATREWKDGLLSKIMRDLGEMRGEEDKWIVLDGDLDANWIESMNSVMDDNRMLTLASNERIPLLSNMRMIFEIRDLAYATPATTSRAGIIFISTEGGSQWQSLIAAWVQKTECSDVIKEVFAELFEKYVSTTLDKIRSSFKPLIPIEETNMVASLLHMLGTMVTDKMISAQDTKAALKAIEPAFVFCAVWAFGSCFSEKDGVDYRQTFSDWWRAEFKTVRFPNRETVFDYYLDNESDKFDLWKNSSYFYSIEYDTSIPMTQVTVPTPETAAVTFWMDRMLAIERPLLLVGPAGCGKTAIVKGLLQNLDPSDKVHTTINFNYYTNAIALQSTIESKLEKKTGSNYGPAGHSGNLIYFLDDLNLPQVDSYNTQDAIALLRQHIDYDHLYDRQKLVPKNVSNVQYVACMNNTAGSFTVNPRLQRHFVSFAVGFPGSTSLLTIYQTFLDGHLKNFDDSIKALCTGVINAALSLHADVVSRFRKTATNFHYEFNIRHLSNLFQGLLVAQPTEFSDPEKFVMLWVHESERVYGDRLVSARDLQKYHELAAAQAKRKFPNFNMGKFFASENADPLVFCHFAENTTDKAYDNIVSMDALHKTLTQSLAEYNETNAQMNLVLFADAMKHICRITRIILNPSGHAMLIGVGGSGKQSLARLAAFICGYDTVQIVITPSYSINDFKEDLKLMYNRAGLKNDGVAFLFVDSQITNERFLVLLNDLLSSGNIPDLFTTEDIDGIVAAVHNKVKAAGLPTDRASCYEYYLNQIRQNLHCILCFSPVGDDFRTRARKFPALVTCTVIDWFQPWPTDALHSVTKSFLKDLDLSTPEIRDGIERFMPFSFESVNKIAARFRAAEKRNVYTTPKSFLELIKLYESMLTNRREQNRKEKSRLESGLKKLRSTAEIVGNLEAELHEKLLAAEEKKVIAEAQAEEVERESEIVQRETEAATLEKAKCDKIAAEVKVIADDAQRDLDAAEPLVRAALECLDTLNKKDIGECRQMTTPPKGVDDVFKAVMVLMAGFVPTIVTTKTGKVKNLSFEGAKKEMMQNANEFLVKLKEFKEEVDAFRVPKINWKEVRPFLDLEHFNPETIEKKNKAAGGICAWVRNIVTYYDTIVGVEPQKQALAEVQLRLQEANDALNRVNARVAELESRLNTLKTELAEANALKQKAIDEVENGKLKRDLAQRLITALASENVRWATNIEEYDAKYELLVGDVLLAAAFISYIGPFSKEYRNMLINDEWIPFLKTASAGESIPMSELADPVSILSGESEVANWNVHGLPADKVSTENGSITTNSARWPLLIDPQLQAIAWLQSFEVERIKSMSLPSSADAGSMAGTARTFKTVRLGSPGLINTLIAALEHGDSVLIESMGERIDAALMPVVRRNIVHRGKKQFVQIGDKEVDFHPDFQLYLHTKLSNPHYPPEIQAECTLINFTVTQSGLEDQLLALVVRKERSELAEQRARLMQQENRFKVKMKELEDNILLSLADAEGDVTEDVSLIESLEDTKRVANEIEEQSAAAVESQELISKISELYRPVASRGSLLFFILNSMYKLHPYYIYSLNAFVVIFLRGIDLVSEKQDSKGPSSIVARLKAAARKVIVTQRFNWNVDLLNAARMPTDGLEISIKDQADVMTEAEVDERCRVLERSITSTVFNCIRRGLFEEEKLCFASQVCFKLMQQSGTLKASDLELLVLNKPVQDPGSMGALSSWMSEAAWAKVKGLEVIDGMDTLGDDMMSDADEWKAWYDAEAPELIGMPSEYKNLDSFKQLLIFRALRPDRMNSRLTSFVEEFLGSEYIEQPAFDMESTYQEMSPSTPIFFVLFPGVDPTPWVEELGRKMAVTEEKGKFFNISMGQGQEHFAEKKILEYANSGGWIMLQNIHLMTSWLPQLERILEQVSESAHQDFRCFLSAEAPGKNQPSNVPESLLQSCIKVANEAPADLKSNLRSSWANFSQARIDAVTKKKEFTQCLFTLCFFHSLVLGRRKFGQIGWSRPYSFNDGDLNICADVLESYTESNSSIPWLDLRYIFGEIMYGGHITDPWDRRTNNTYLELLLDSSMTSSSGFTLAPGFSLPPGGSTDFKKIKSYIEDKLPKESPVLFGLHANAEIGFRTATQDYLFSCTLKLGLEASSASSQQALDAATGADSNSNLALSTADQKLRSDLQSYIGQLPVDFNLDELNSNGEAALEGEQGPYTIVLMQECTRMNNLLNVLRTSLSELQQGLDGALNMSESMEHLAAAMTINQVPGRDPTHKCSWEKHAWWSRKSLSSWFRDLLLRIQQLTKWSATMELPFSLWLPGLFVPTSFNTAIMQATARRKGLPLEKTTTETHVTTYLEPDRMNQYPVDGAYVHGLMMEGARWVYSEDPDSPQDPSLAKVTEVGNSPTGGYLESSKLKELLAPMPVMYIRAVETSPEWESSSVGFLRKDPTLYECPVYVTRFRGPTYIFLATLKTAKPVSKWILSGTALLLQNDE